MPAIAAWIAGALLSVAGSFVGRILFSLGLAFVEYQGISALLDSVKNQILSALGGFESSGFALMIAWGGFFRFDVHITLVLSAIGVKLALNGMTGGVMRKLASKR